MEATTTRILTQFKDEQNKTFVKSGPTSLQRADGKFVSLKKPDGTPATWYSSGTPSGARLNFFVHPKNVLLEYTEKPNGKIVELPIDSKTTVGSIKKLVSNSDDFVFPTPESVRLCMADCRKELQNNESTLYKMGVNVNRNRLQVNPRWKVVLNVVDSDGKNVSKIIGYFGWRPKGSDLRQKIIDTLPKHHFQSISCNDTQMEMEEHVDGCQEEDGTEKAYKVVVTEKEEQKKENKPVKTALPTATAAEPTKKVVQGATGRQPKSSPQPTPSPTPTLAPAPVVTPLPAPAPTPAPKVTPVSTPTPNITISFKAKGTGFFSGWRLQPVEISPTQTISDVKTKFLEKNPSYEADKGKFGIARNQKFLPPTQTLSELDITKDTTLQILYANVSVQMEFPEETKIPTQKKEYPPGVPLKEIRQEAAKLLNIDNIKKVELHLNDDLLRSQNDAASLLDILQGDSGVIKVSIKDETEYFTAQIFTTSENQSKKQGDARLDFLANPITYTIGDLKREIQKKYNIPFSELRARFGDNDDLSDDLTLEKIGIKATQTVPVYQRNIAKAPVGAMTTSAPIKTEASTTTKTPRVDTFTPAVTTKLPAVKTEASTAKKPPRADTVTAKSAASQVSERKNFISAYQMSIMNNKNPEYRTDWAQFVSEVQSEIGGRKFRDVTTLFSHLRSLSDAVLRKENLTKWDSLFAVCVWFEHNLYRKGSSPKDARNNVFQLITNHVYENRAIFKSPAEYVRNHFVKPLRVLSRYNVLFQCDTPEQSMVYSSFCKHILEKGPKGGQLDDINVQKYRCAFFWAKMFESLCEAHVVLKSFIKMVQQLQVLLQSKPCKKLDNQPLRRVPPLIAKLSTVAT